MHILIAPNAFKNSLTALQAASSIEKGFLESDLDCTCECFPIADGGDGTGELIIKKCDGVLATKEVNDPFGRKISSSFGLIDDEKTAVIEMADSSGLRLLQTDELNPLLASTFGTGEIIRFALDKGVNKIIIGMGGSATVDGATGILRALGVRFLDAQNNELSNLPGSLVHLDKIDTSALDKRVFSCDITVLCDVDNTLLGPSGAATVFGPQKGATPAAVVQLDAALSRLQQITLQQTGKDIGAIKYGGTAGGAAAGLYAFLNAKLVSGAEHFLQLTGFHQSLLEADIVITGEGSIDKQTVQGKGPAVVAQLAKKRGLPVFGLAGKVPLQPNGDLRKYFDVLLAIGNGPADVASAMLYSADNLARTARELGNLMALSKSGKRL